MTDLNQPRSRRLHPVAIAATIVLVLLAAAIAWVGIRALLVKSELEALIPLSDKAEAAIAERDVDSIARVADELGERASSASALSGDPIWRAFEVIPWLGPNLTAARVTSAQLAEISADVVDPLLSLALEADDAEAQDSGAEADAASGSSMLAVVDAARDPLEQAAETLGTASVELGAIDTESILPAVANGVVALRDVVDAAAPSVATLSDVIDVLPGLLGAEEPRSVLLMFQNPAELRTGGGISGTFALLSVSQGDIEIVEQLDSADFPRRDSPILELPDDTAVFWGDIVGTFVQNTTMTSEFALSAELATQWWDTYAPAGVGESPDAVISIDPVFLRAVLAATGDVQLPDGSQITADNVLERVLVDPYMTLNSDGQTQFFEQVTALALAQFSNAFVDPIAAVDAFATPVSEGRISVWSADPVEQEALAKTPLAGSAARHRAAGDDAYAVYFNDATGGKMDTFLDARISVGVAECRDDGRRDVHVSVEVTSTAPPEARDYRAGMTGGGIYGVTPGNIRTNVAVAAPSGSFYGGVELDGAPVLSNEGDVEGFAMTTSSVELAPGETKTLDFHFISAEAGQIEPTIVHTPMATKTVVEEMAATCE